MRPDFTKIELKPAVERAQARGNSERLSPEHISVKGFYTREDLKGLEHLEYAAGIPPYLRGPYSTMYVMRPWTIRQYAGFSTAKNPMRFIAGTWLPGRRAFRSPSILPRTGDTIPITSALPEMWARRAWRLIRSWT